MSSAGRTWAAIAALAAAVIGLALSTERADAATRILYASGGKLLAVSPRGGTRHRIGSVPRSTLDISASADGRHIALISNRKLEYPNRGSIRTIYLFTVGQGLDVVRRFRSTAPLDIAISPNGRLIAFGRSSEIWIMRANGSGARQVTNGFSVAWDPAFTPDGGGIVFDRDDLRRPRNRPRLYRTSLGGGAEVRLTEGEARSPAISSRGLLTYIRPAEGRVPDRLVVMRLDGSGRHTVHCYNDPIFDMDPTFSPNGRAIAYMRLWERTGYASSYRYSIHTMTAAGRGDRKVLGGLRSTATNPPFAGHGPAGPVWTRVP